MKIDLPDGGLVGLVVLLFGQMALGVWHVSAAWARLRAHEVRLDRLETKSEAHEDKLDVLLSDIKDRLARIEGALSRNRSST